MQFEALNLILIFHIQMLLSYGANPNIRVYGEMGSNAILRPPLAELLSSNDNVLLEVS